MNKKIISYPAVKTRKPKKRIKFRHRMGNPKISLCNMDIKFAHPMLNIMSDKDRERIKKEIEDFEKNAGSEGSQ